jgi:hypothetical protein
MSEDVAPYVASADQVQVGGNHYKDLPVQPWNFILPNALPWGEGEIVKYVSRWRRKGGVEDLRKARHLIDKLIEVAVNDGAPPCAQASDARLAIPDDARHALAGVNEVLGAAAQDIMDWAASIPGSGRAELRNSVYALLAQVEWCRSRILSVIQREATP